DIVLRFVYFSRLQPRTVIADTSTPFGRFGRTIDKQIFSGLTILRNHIWLAAGPFHLAERPKLFQMRLKLRTYLPPVESVMPFRMSFKSGLKDFEQIFHLSWR